jgi:hypothetical protein
VHDDLFALTCVLVPGRRKGSGCASGTTPQILSSAILARRLTGYEAEGLELHAIWPTRRSSINGQATSG